MLGKQIKVLNIREKIKIVLKLKGVICNLVKKKKNCNDGMRFDGNAMIQWLNTMSFIYAKLSSFF